MFYVIYIRKQIDNGKVTDTSTYVFPSDGTSRIEDAEDMMKDKAVKLHNSVLSQNCDIGIEDKGNEIFLWRKGKMNGRTIEMTFKIVKDI